MLTGIKATFKENSINFRNYVVTEISLIFPIAIFIYYTPGHKDKHEDVSALKNREIKQVWAKEMINFFLMRK